MDDLLRSELTTLLRSTYHDDIRTIGISLGGVKSSSSSVEVETSNGDTSSHSLMQEQLEWERRREIREQKASYVLGGSRASESLKEAVGRFDAKEKRKRQRRQQQAKKKEVQGKRKRRKPATNLREKVDFY